VEMLDLIAPDRRKTLFVTANIDANVMLSSRNIPRVVIRTAIDLNTVDVLDADRVVIVRDALAKLEERLA
ncbi:MAG: 50S ribosomal protein L4, partial [Candidatus Hydrogenedentes bacterium]|nr:50S ribosomal protein L4 [Candidatus Hydrogenedentota bacterium]